MHVSSSIYLFNHLKYSTTIIKTGFCEMLSDKAVIYIEIF